MTDLSIEPVTERCTPEPGTASDLFDRDERWPADPPSPRGVRLTRLIGLAGLTAPQVLEIGAGLLAEVARRSESNTDALGGGQIMTDQIVIDTDGRVMLGPASHDERNGRSSSRVVSTVTAVEALLADLAGAGRARRADPATDQLLAELDRAMTLLPVAGVSEVAQMVEIGCAAIDRTVVRAELAALVSAIVESPGSARSNEPTGGPPSSVRGINTGGVPRAEEPGPPAAGSEHGCCRWWSSPQSSCWRSLSSATTSSPTSTCSWTPGDPGRVHPPRRRRTVCRLRHSPRRRPEP